MTNAPVTGPAVAPGESSTVVLIAKNQKSPKALISKRISDHPGGGFDDL
jgi:hypothetical protein